MDEKRAIVLVSGWSGSKSDFYWGTFKRRWVNEGYDVLQAGFPYRGFAHIRQSANAVEKVLEAIHAQYDHITLVGHSMGGLVGRYVIQRKLRSDLVNAYVSIGTPHRGSVLAALMPFSASAMQMKPDSPFLKRLNESAWPEEIPALALQGQFEEIVWPQSSAKFEPAKNVKIPWATHLGLVLSQRTFWEIWAWLELEVAPRETLQQEQKAHASTVKAFTK